MSETTKKSGLALKAVLIFLLLVSLAGNALLGSLYWQERNHNPEMDAQAELDMVMAEISKLITLPEGATPVLATVSNAEDLRNRQAFFENAEDGDKLLLYNTATESANRKAYLYRPSTKQLINVAPINVGGQIQPQQDEFSIDIRNATLTEGLEDQMEALLSQVFPNATVVAKGEANQDYDQSSLIQVNASSEVARKVSELFSVELIDLPETEDPNPETDLILILGGSSDATGSAQTSENGTVTDQTTTSDQSPEPAEAETDSPASPSAQ